jgi:pilus assembly protein CpaF
MNARSANPLAPLEPLLNDPSVTEILADGSARVYVERHGKLEDVPSPFRDDEHLLEVIQALIEPLGRRVDESAPMVSARLADGSRLQVVIPPISLVGPSLTLRRFASVPLTLEDAIRFGVWNEDMVTFLRACVQGRTNIIVAGGTASGKTTLMNILGAMIPAEERIITVENAAELRLPQARVVTLESRPPNIEGKGEITVRDLLFSALRMRPDRIVLGELRGAEVLDLFQAASTGHDGTMATMHAASLRDVLTRLEMMATYSDFTLPLLTVRQMMASAINLITYQERMRDGTRKMLKVAEVVGMQGDIVVTQDLFEFRQIGFQEGRISGYHTATGNIPRCLGRLSEAGIDLPVSVFTPK